MKRKPQRREGVASKANASDRTVAAIPHHAERTESATADRTLSDDELAQILEVKIERIPDPDFPQMASVRESYVLHFGTDGPPRPATPEEVAAYRASMDEQRIPHRLANARRGLAKIAGTPEHRDAEVLLRSAESLWRRVEYSRQQGSGVEVNRHGDKLLAALDHLVDVIGFGLRRIDVVSDVRSRAEEERRRRVSGAEATNKVKRKKAADTRADVRVQMNAEAAELEKMHPRSGVNAILAQKHDVSARTIRNIRADPAASKKRKPR